jgi:DNA end-binding protein Ku
MPRAIWKGAISFGLVHIPVALVSATSQQGVDFDWLDKRTMDPVGYKRINKVTGKDIVKENIVKGVQYEKGRYVVISEEEIKSAHPRSTQTIEIFAFVDSSKIPLQHIDTPYFLAPDKRGEKVYALLRQTLVDTNKVALANVVIRTSQHLAAVMPVGPAIVLVLLRWPSEVRNLATLELTKDVTEAKLNKNELNMAKRLVEDMAADWEPDEYRDTFQDKIMELVETKAREGKIENVETDAGEGDRKTADVIDLTELLKRSLGGKRAPSTTTTPRSASEGKAKESVNEVSTKRRGPPRRKAPKAS